MYRDFINSIENKIENELKERNIQVKILNSHYDDWGIVYPVEKTIETANEKIGILVDSKIYIVSNYKEQKYCTKTTEDKIKFWEYDYKRCFPVKCRPRLVVFGRSSTELDRLFEKIQGLINDRIYVNMKHPILSNDVIPIVLSIDKTKPIKINQLNDNVAYYEILFNNLVCPYFINSFSLTNLDTPLKNRFAIDIIFSLFNIEKCCQQFIEENAMNDTIVAHHNEKLYMIKNNHRNLMDRLGIPETMWDELHLKRIDEKILKNNLTIIDAVDATKREDKEQEVKEAKQLQIAEEKRRQEQQRRQRQEVVTYDDECSDASPRILRGIAHGVVDYATERKEKKERKEIAKPHLMGSYGCRYIKYHTCALCPLRNKCADYY